MKKMMKKRFFVILCFLVLFFFASIRSRAEEVGELHALSAVLMDAESGRILYEKNGNEFRANASTTKILTCILALEMGEAKDLVEVSEYAQSMPDVQLNIKEGETYYLQDLLYSLMLESHNDTAVAIAEHLAGSCENFSKIMNKKAKEIGCENTYFITPNGLDAVLGENTHGTTAADLGRLMRYCIYDSPKKEEFLRITQAREYCFTDMEGKRNFSCHNHNSFFNLMEGVLTGKTGFTNKAGYCYVGALKEGERTYIAVVLGSGWPGNKNYKWQDCQKLMKYGMENYQRYDLGKITPATKEMESIVVEGGQNQKGEYQTTVPMEAEKTEMGILMKEEEGIRVKLEKEKVKAPVSKGEVVGKITYWIENTKIAERKLYLKEKVEEINYRWCLSILMKRIFS